MSPGCLLAAQSHYGCPNNGVLNNCVGHMFALCDAQKGELQSLRKNQMKSKRGRKGVEEGVERVRGLKRKTV